MMNIYIGMGLELHVGSKVDIGVMAHVTNTLRSPNVVANGVAPSGI